MLPPDVIAAIRVFLERVQLSGKEVPAYTKVMMCLASEENEQRVKAEADAAARTAAKAAARVGNKKDNGTGKVAEESSPPANPPVLDAPENTPPSAE